MERDRGWALAIWDFLALGFTVPTLALAALTTWLLSPVLTIPDHTIFLASGLVWGVVVLVTIWAFVLLRSRSAGNSSTGKEPKA